MVSKRWLITLVASGVLPFAVSAQDDAGRIEKRFDKPPEPKSTLQPLLIQLQEQLPPKQALEIRFTLKELVLKGNSAFRASELQPLYVRDAITVIKGVGEHL